MRRKIIFFELNEVPRRIVEEYCRWSPGSTLARRLSEFHFYDTFAQDEATLSPWITWSSLHRGVIDQQHMIHDFGQDLGEVNRQFPQIWQLLSARGVRTGVCGSLHSYPPPDDPQNYTFYLPDTFAAGSECFPKQLSAFQDFNLRMARESARNISLKTPWTSALSFLGNAPSLGLKARTVLDVGRQLAAERLWSWKKVRRRTYQTVLAFDIFFKQLERTRPDFCTFFTNHVASSMHRFWAAAFPDDYDTFQYDDEWVRTYCREINFTMGKFDDELRRLLKFVDANPEYQLWLATSMGQAATEARPLETQLYVTDRRRFMAALGLDEDQWHEQPAMLPRYCFRVTPERVVPLIDRLSRLRIDGQSVEYKLTDENFVRVKFGQQNMHERGECATLDDRPIAFADLGLDNVRIEDRSSSNAYHVPEGCLMIYDPRDREPPRQRTTISTIDVAPALLRNFDIRVPDYMNPAATLSSA